MQIHNFSSSQLKVFQAIPSFRTLNSIQIESSHDPVPLLDQLPDLGLAIVGTRYPQRRSFDLLEATFKKLRGTGLVIVSGFARGIDSRAHELAIDSGLFTVAILGCGMDVDYPRENRFLRQKILDHGGMIISQFKPGTPPYASNFLERNQLIAGFAKATWVVEAAEVSGTLNTANWAMHLNRDLYATSCFPGDTFFKGNEKLLSQRHPDRFPVADPFFGAESLSKSWSIFNERPELNLTRHSHTPWTQIQRWVHELKTEYGSCPVQSLMTHASTQGLTPGAFYLKYEQELVDGLLVQDPEGRVEIAKCRT